MGNKIFVGNLSWESTEEELNKLFAESGQVTSVKIITDKFTGQPKGFAFVEMATDADARKAIEALNGTMLKDRALTVNEARPPKERENRGHGGGGGRGGYSGNNRPGGGSGGGRRER
ncbi:MAG: RNA-binding protein [Geobacteraceae bacterium]|jgi:RNA recognition motif-containing protein